MQTYRVTIPAIDEVDVHIEADTPARAGLRLLNISNAIENADPEESIEVIVESEMGKKYILAAEPVTTFRMREVG